MKISQIPFIVKYKKFTILILSFMYVFVGVKHFTDPQYFIEITPTQIHNKSFVVYFTGAIEILGGLLILAKKTRTVGAYTLILLLIIVFPANIYLYLYEGPQKLLGITELEALIRMPFQAPLIIIAFWHSKEDHPKWLDYLSAIIFVPTIMYFISI